MSELWKHLEHSVFNTVTAAATYAALVVITGRLVPLELRNTGQALMQIFGAGIGPIVGPAVGGFIYVHIGPSSLFLVSAAGVLAGIVVVWRALRPAEE